MLHSRDETWYGKLLDPKDVTCTVVLLSSSQKHTQITKYQAQVNDSRYKLSNILKI